MTIGRLALDLWLAAVLLSVTSIGLFFVLWVGASVLTVVRAVRRARRLPHELGELRRCYSARELASLNEVLSRILAEEHGTLPGRRPR